MTEGIKPPLFPISREAVNRALTDIARDPQTILAAEWDTLRQTGYLGTALSMQARSESFDGSDKDFTAGAALAHKIIREQAALLGQSVPEVPYTEYAIYQDEALFGPVTPGTSSARVHVPHETVLKRIADADPEFIRGTLDQSVYTPTHTGAFYFGIRSTYPFYKRAEEIERFNKSFNGK